MDRSPLTTLNSDSISVAPSILAADFSRLGDEILAVEAAGVELIHIDVMDGHFVPNLSIGPPVVKAIRKVTRLPFDVHLMLAEPSHYISPFLNAGADNITIHVEIEEDIASILARIRSAGASAGISLRPGTRAQALAPFISLVDLILVMTVEPGFGGQEFMVNMLPKIREIRTMIDRSDRPVHLEVDGGIKAETAHLVKAAGARMLVAGSSVFRASEGIADAVAALRRPA